MPKREKTERRDVPSYLHHRASGRAFTYLRGADGPRRRVYLGKWNSPDSRRRYRELIGRYLLEEEQPSATATNLGTNSATCITVAELCARYLHHRQALVVESEWNQARLASIPLLALYRDLPADEIGPKALRRVRDEMVTAGTLCRTEVNRRVVRIRAMFRWAAAEELIPAGVVEAQRTLEPLRRGRTGAHEANPVEPVPEADIEATLPYLPPTLQTMVRMQLLTGMRVGELLALRGRDIDQTNEPWIYRPRAHKNAWRDMHREIPLVRAVQAMLVPHLDAQPDVFLFSPRKTHAERRRMKRAARKSRVQPSQQARDERTRDSASRLADQWTATTYRHAIHYACRRAGVPLWTPSRLRHNFQHRAELLVGLEESGRALGHHHTATVEHYRSRRDLAVAVRVMDAVACASGPW
ncbi:MAG: site-specific integrase [Planctomycetota bacterium]